MSPVKLSATPANGQDVPQYPWSTGDTLYAEALNDAIAQAAAARPPTVIISDTPPANVPSGWMWWNTQDGNTYVWYGPDPTGSYQWVPAMFSGGSPIVPGGGPYLPLTGNTTLPSTKPSTPGTIWNNGGVICVS